MMRFDNHIVPTTESSLELRRVLRLPSRTLVENPNGNNDEEEEEKAE